MPPYKNVDELRLDKQTTTNKKGKAMSDIPKELRAETKEEKKQAKNYAKNIDRVLKEVQNMLKPEGSVMDKMLYKIMLGKFRGEIKDTVQKIKPSYTRDLLILLIKRLKWVLDAS